MSTAEQRILVACSMKSGSTYVAKVLSLYFGIPIANPFDFWGEREQNLYPWHFDDVLSGPFVLQLHIKPHPPHLRLFEQYGMQVVYQWRNLGDAIVSFDDHVINEDWRNPVCYVDNTADYAAQPKDVRHKYLIRHALPWYISFHLMWARIGNPSWLIRCRYEEMCTDPTKYFAHTIEFFGFEINRERLRAILSKSLEQTRFNVGLTGRSNSELSEDNKTLLEQMLIEHPQDLSELLHELPWWPSERGRSPAARLYDNKIIRIHGTHPEDEKVYLVKDGKRRWITSPQWIETAGRHWNELCFLTYEQLQSIPLGPPLGV